MRKALHLEPGDIVSFKIEDGSAIIQKINPIDYQYHMGIAHNLSEWDSKEDDEAYHDFLSRKLASYRRMIS